MFHRGFSLSYEGDETLNYSCEYERINIHGEKGSSWKRIAVCLLEMKPQTKWR